MKSNAPMTPSLRARASPSGVERTFDFARHLQAARRGARDSQDALCRYFYPRVERIVHAQLRRELGLHRGGIAARFSSSDVVQEVFLRVIAGLNGFQGDSEAQFQAYLVAIVRHRILDAVRHHAAARRDYRRNAFDVDDTRWMALLPARNHDSRADFAAADFAPSLAPLSLAQRRILRARVERHLTFEEIAAELGYTSRYAARRAFFAAQAQWLVERGAARQRVPPRDPR